MPDTWSSTGRPKTFRGGTPKGELLDISLDIEFSIKPDFRSVSEKDQHLLYVQPFSLLGLCEGDIRIVTYSEQRESLTGPFVTPAGAVEVYQRVEFSEGNVIPALFFNSPPAIEVVIEALSLEVAEELEVLLIYQSKHVYNGVAVLDRLTRQGNTIVRFTRWVSPENKTPSIIYVPEKESAFTDFSFAIGLK